ncbi:MAG: DinB family protein [Flavobacteriales bacterium]|nr:DinB family protein [Flavobacteriales bacterium]
MLVVSLSEELLYELKRVVQQLNDLSYSKKLPLLSNNSIGQHVRHILEFYECLLKGTDTGVVDYDSRERKMILEQNGQEAITFIEYINSKINSVSAKDLLLSYQNGDRSQTIPTSFERELAYNIEHALHHMAIIKISVQSDFPSIELPEHFGVAPSTVKYLRSVNVHG